MTRRNPKERTGLGEKIGGGFFVFRRGKKTGRIAVKRNAMPFEHPSYESAKQEVARLERENLGEKFSIMCDITLVNKR